MNAKIKRRLEHLAETFGPGEIEQIQAGLLRPKKSLCVVARLVFGTPDLTKSICRRTLYRDGTVCEYVELRDSNDDLGGGDGLSDEALRRWIASHPIEIQERQQ